MDTNIIVTTENKLNEIVIKAVNIEFRRILKELQPSLFQKEPSQPPEEKLLTTKDLCKLFQTTKMTIYSWRRNGLIKAYKMAGRIFFKYSEVMQALDKWAIKKAKP